MRATAKQGRTRRCGARRRLPHLRAAQRADAREKLQRGEGRRLGRVVVGDFLLQVRDSLLEPLQASRHDALAARARDHTEWKRSAVLIGDVKVLAARASQVQRWCHRHLQSFRKEVAVGGSLRITP